MTIDPTDIDRRTRPDLVPLERQPDSNAGWTEFSGVTVTEAVAG